MFFANHRNGAVVLEPFGMGDIVSLLPLVFSLGEEFPVVTVAAKGRWAKILPNEAWLKHLPVDLPWSSYSKKEKYSAKSLLSKGLFRTVQDFRKECKGFVGFDPRGDIRNVLFLYICGCQKVFTLDHYLGTDARLPKWAADLVCESRDFPRWKLALQLLEKNHGMPLSSGPAVARPSPARQEIKKIGFVPTAPWGGKHWPMDRWVELSKRLSASGYEISVFFGPGDRSRVQEFKECGNIIECLDIDAWKTNLCEVDLVVTLDTGPMHLADAMGIPIVALFGNSPLPLWAPSGFFSRTVHHQGDPEFRPEQQLDGNERDGLLWMEKITVDEVYESVDSLVVEFNHQRQPNGVRP